MWVKSIQGNLVRDTTTSLIDGILESLFKYILHIFSFIFGLMLQNSFVTLMTTEATDKHTLRASIAKDFVVIKAIS